MTRPLTSVVTERYVPAVPTEAKVVVTVEVPVPVTSPVNVVAGVEPAVTRP